ncbi:MAG: hypothetical protein JW852_12130 [Spirochaetales bacterium]|nr:hypothetical protein [Spirochaetales bacterium]
MNRAHVSCFIAVILTFVVPAVLFSFGSEEVSVTAYEEFPEALGFQYGEIAASGLSYHAWRDKVGFQVAGGIVYIPLTEDFWFERTLDYSVGTEIHLRVYGEDFAHWLSGQLYGFAGLNHGGYIPIETVKSGYMDEDDEWVPPELATGSYTPTFGFGIGIGIEIILFRHFSIPLELGYGVVWMPTAPTVPEQFNVNLMPQAGFRYRY